MPRKTKKTNPSKLAVAVTEVQNEVTTMQNQVVPILRNMREELEFLKSEQRDTAIFAGLATFFIGILIWKVRRLESGR